MEVQGKEVEMGGAGISASFDSPVFFVRPVKHSSRPRKDRQREKGSWEM